MSDLNAAVENGTPSQPAAPAAPSPSAAPSAPASSPEQAAPANPGNPSAALTREAINQRYRELYSDSKPVDGGVAPAQSDSTPSPAEPSAPATSDTAPSSPTPAQPDRLAKVEEQLTAVTEALAALLQPAKPAPAVAAPAPSAASTESELKFWELAKEGKLKEAQEALIGEAVKQAVAQAKKESVAETLEMSRVERDITEFLTDLRGKNSDLLPLEDLIVARAATKLEAAKQAGRITDMNAYVREYKAAVQAGAEEARAIVQTFRASGKNEANTRNSEVINASTLTPNKIDQNRGEPTKQSGPQIESTADYLAKRKEAAERMRWGSRAAA